MLCMKGHIRTNQHCPKCKKAFEKIGNKLICKACLTSPNRLFIDLHFDGERLKIYKDDSGQVLDSYDRAERLLNHVRWEIDNHKFKADRYRKTRYEPYQFETYAKAWIKEQEIRLGSNEISYSTFYKQKMVLKRYIAPYFGLRDIRQVSTKDVKTFNLSLAETIVKGDKKMSPKYREYVIGLLRQIFYDGMRSGDLNRAQVPLFPTVDTPDTYFDFLTEEEQDEILAKIPEHDYPIFHFILWYGLRPSETRALKRDAIIGDFQEAVIRRTFTRNNRLRENPKENRWRVIPLNNETREIMKALVPSFTGFVFVNKWGRHYSQQYLNDKWNQACKDAGFRYIPLKNASRHSLGTKLAREGLGENMIAKVLGHADSKTTKHYVRYASEGLRPFFERRKVKKGTVQKLSVTKK